MGNINKVSLCICVDPKKFGQKDNNEIEQNTILKIALDDFLAKLNSDKKGAQTEISLVKIALKNPGPIDLESTNIEEHQAVYTKLASDMVAFPNIEEGNQIGNTGLSVLTAMKLLKDRRNYYKRLGDNITTILLLITDGKISTSISDDIEGNRQEAYDLICKEETFNNLFAIPVLITNGAKKLDDKIMDASFYKKNKAIIQIDSIKSDDFTYFLNSLACAIIEYEKQGDMQELINLFDAKETQDPSNLIINAFKKEETIIKPVNKPIVETKQTVNTKKDFVKETVLLSDEHFTEILKKLEAN